MVMSKTFSGCGAAAALGVEGGALLAGAPADGGLLAADGGVLGANDGTAEAVARRSLEARRQPAKVTRPATTASGKSNERRVKAAPFTTRLLGVLGERRGVCLLATWAVLRRNQAEPVAPRTRARTSPDARTWFHAHECAQV